MDIRLKHATMRSPGNPFVVLHISAKMLLGIPYSCVNFQELRAVRHLLLRHQKNIEHVR